jgi:hypothetical protein
MNDRPQPIERLQFETTQLIREHPPQWHDRNKQIVHEIACPPGSVYQGQLEYSRWGAMPLPETVDTQSAARRIADRPGFYDYTASHDHTDAVEWHVNFADPHRRRDRVRARHRVHGVSRGGARVGPIAWSGIARRGSYRVLGLRRVRRPSGAQ